MVNAIGGEYSLLLVVVVVVSGGGGGMVESDRTRLRAGVCEISRVLSRSCRTSLASATTMASAGDQEESAKLWKVNRTIHELVKDRVSARVMACRKGRDEPLVSQGFQVSDDEINMDLTNFRAHYASQTGSVE